MFSVFFLFLFCLAGQLPEHSLSKQFFFSKHLNKDNISFEIILKLRNINIYRKHNITNIPLVVKILNGLLLLALKKKHFMSFFFPNSKYRFSIFAKI